MAVSSRVCSQLKIIMFLSYLDRGLPRSRSTSRNVSGKLFVTRCLATRKTAAFVLLMILFAGGCVPGTLNLVVPVVVQLVLTLAAAVDAGTSILSKLNSLCDNLSRALYVVNNLLLI